MAKFSDGDFPTIDAPTAALKLMGYESATSGAVDALAAFNVVMGALSGNADWLNRLGMLPVIMANGAGTAITSEFTFLGEVYYRQVPTQFEGNAAAVVSGALDSFTVSDIDVTAYTLPSPLEPGIGYVQFVEVTTGGTRTNWVTEAYDIPPTLSNGGFESATTTAFDVTCETDLVNSGMIDWAMLVNGTTPPANAAALRAYSVGGAVLAIGSFIPDASPDTLPFSGLTIETDYDIYLVQNAADDRSGSDSNILKVDAATQAAALPLALADLQVYSNHTQTSVPSFVVPATAVVGNWAFLAARMAAGSGTIVLTSNHGWTQVADISGDGRTTVWKKQIAPGDPGATHTWAFTGGTSSSVNSIFGFIEVEGSSGAVTVSALSATVNPPVVNLAGVAATVGIAVSTTTRTTNAVTAGPSGWLNFDWDETLPDQANDGHATMAVASLESSVDTFDPGAFTWSGSTNLAQAFTVAIR